MRTTTLPETATTLDNFAMRKFIRNLILPILFPMLGCGVANARHDADRENTAPETTGNMTYVESRPVTGYYSWR